MARKRSSRNGPAGCSAFPHTMATIRQRTVAAAIFTRHPWFEGRRQMRTLMRTGTPLLRRVDEHAILLPHDAVLDDVDDVRQRNDVEQRITVDDDDVGELAGLHRAQLASRTGL